MACITIQPFGTSGSYHVTQYRPDNKWYIEQLLESDETEDVYVLRLAGPFDTDMEAKAVVEERVPGATPDWWWRCGRPVA